MSMHRRVLSLLVASTLGCAWAAQSQDSQSLGDAARQARLQKQQKDAKAKDAPANSQETRHTPPERWFPHMCRQTTIRGKLLQSN